MSKNDTGNTGSSYAWCARMTMSGSSFGITLLVPVVLVAAAHRTRAGVEEVLQIPAATGRPAASPPRTSTPASSRSRETSGSTCVQRSRRSATTRVPEPCSSVHRTPRRPVQFGNGGMSSSATRQSSRRSPDADGPRTPDADTDVLSGSRIAGASTTPPTRLVASPAAITRHAVAVEHARRADGMLEQAVADRARHAVANTTRSRRAARGSGAGRAARSR